MYQWRQASSFTKPSGKESRPLLNERIDMFILKIKGANKIPDYVQIRDDHFTLIAYFKITHPERALEKCGLGREIRKIMEIARRLPYGKIRRLEL